MSARIDPDAVRDRWLQLTRPGVLDALRAERASSVVGSRWMPWDSEDHRPEPYWPQQLGRSAAHERIARAVDDTVVGLDALGRPTYVDATGGRELRHFDLLTWAGDQVEVVVERNDDLKELQVFALGESGPVERVSCGWVSRRDGRPEVGLARYVRDKDGRVVLALEIEESGSDDSSGEAGRGRYWTSRFTRFVHDADGLTRVEFALGRDRIACGEDHEAAFLAAGNGMADGLGWRTVWDRSKPPGGFGVTTRRSGDRTSRSYVGAEPTPITDERVADRRELVAILQREGLPKDGAELVAADAAWAVVLEPGGSGESRLGGLPVLPVDARWPTADARPLTHLSTIALHELPEVEGRAQLPKAGYLSFFADLSEAAELYDPIWPGDPRRDLVAVLHARTGTATHEPLPPDGPRRAQFDPPIVLHERRVRPTSRLQIRDPLYDSAAKRRYGLDDVHDAVLQGLVTSINGEIEHQLLGFPPVVQGDPRDDGQVALFHVGYDQELGFEFLDVGDLFFFASQEDIRAERWDRIIVSPASS